MTISAAHEKASRPSANAQLSAAPGCRGGEGEEQRDALSDVDRSRRRAASRQRPAQGRQHPPEREVKIAASRRSLGPETEPSRPSRPQSKGLISQTRRLPCRSARRRRTPWRRAAQQSAPSRMIAAPAIEAGIHRSGVPSGAGSIVRTAIRQAIPPEPEFSGSPRRAGMRVVGGEPALEGYE